MTEMEQRATKKNLNKESVNSCQLFDFSSDQDNCPAQEINEGFIHRYIEVSTLNVAQEDDSSCIGLMADDHLNKAAFVLSNQQVVLIDRQSFKVLQKESGHTQQITDLGFFPTNSNLICTSSLDGTIIIRDTRSGSVEKTITASTDVCKMAITTFDISSHEKFISAGTELFGSDAFILFWDLRSGNQLGGYWNTHSNDISCVKFNPNHPDSFASADDDGLLNIFDISQSQEQTALNYSLNADVSVQTLCWRNEIKNNLLIYRNNHTVQLWDIQESMPTYTLSREMICTALKRKAFYECYPVLLSCTRLAKNPVLLAASGLQHTKNSNSCVRTLQLNEKTGLLESHGLLISNNEYYSVLQVASISDDSTEILSVCENGLVSLWRKKDKPCLNVMKVNSRHQKRKINPY